MPQRRALDAVIDTAIEKPAAKKAAAKKQATPKEETVVEPSRNNFAKMKALTNDLNAHYKKKIIKSGLDIPSIMKVPFEEPTIDYVYDGGIPIGRFTEMLGQEHSGKTRNALVAMGRFQHYCFGCNNYGTLTAKWKLDKDGFPELISCKCKKCATPETRIMVMVDLEGTTDPKFMHNFGIDTDGILYIRTDMPSTAVDTCDEYLKNPMVGLILFDSVGSMGSDKEVEEAIKDIKMNRNALFLNTAMRKWQASLNFNTNETGVENGTTMIVINQSYASIGGQHSYDIAQGGRGLRHGKGISVKSKIREKVVKDYKGTEVTVGVHIKLTNEKNKTGMPYRKAEYYLNLDPNDPIGYCKTNVGIQYVEMGILFEVIEQKGGWYYYGTEKWQGKAKLITDMADLSSTAAMQVKKAIDIRLYGEAA